MKEQCYSCKFYQGNQYTGRCHRFPPTSGVFAPVASDDWCGEWSLVASVERHYDAPGAALVDRITKKTHV